MKLSTRLPFIPNFPVHDLVNGEPLQDKHLHAIRMMLEYENGPGKAGYGLRSVTDRDLNAALEIAAHQNPFHPVREYLTGLKWDGRARAEKLWIDYLGVEDNAYTRMVARHFLIGAVARAFEPGHKFDFVPILFGAQGKRKSTMIAILAKSWSGELKGNFRDEKHLVEQMMGCWIMELPELSSFKGSIIEDVKAFISAVVSYVRLSYGKLPKEFPRQCVFIGSTNEEEFLNDPTGNRRWWPLRVTCDMIDTDKLSLNVDQIWAETVQMYQAMRAEHPREKGPLPLHLTDAEAAILAAEAQDAAQNVTVVDVLAEAIADYLDGDVNTTFVTKVTHRKHVTINEVWEHGLGRDKTPNDPEAKAVGRAIRACGWVPRPTPLQLVVGLGKKKNFRVFVPGPEVLARWKAEEDGTSLI
jgi:predicted P-loop ATPase